jgi:hypothetical protein
MWKLGLKLNLQTNPFILHIIYTYIYIYIHTHICIASVEEGGITKCTKSCLIVEIREDRERKSDLSNI